VFNGILLQNQKAVLVLRGTSDQG